MFPPVERLGGDARAAPGSVYPGPSSGCGVFLDFMERVLDCAIRVNNLECFLIVRNECEKNVRKGAKNGSAITPLGRVQIP